jgi:hypothetical protein
MVRQNKVYNNSNTKNSIEQLTIAI